MVLVMKGNNKVARDFLMLLATRMAYFLPDPPFFMIAR